MRVRKHRSTLKEAMKTAGVVANQAELDAFFGMPVTIDAHSTFDERNGWHTHIVVDEFDQAVGFSDGTL